MPLKLYNTLTRKKETFKPIKKGQVGMYSCGPTVYWFQHIGNMRMYLFVDIIKRTLLMNNFKVKHVINITDVGHLTSDADEGEDKMVKALKREGLKLNKESMIKVAKKYEDVFKDDLKKLNILDPDYFPKATEHIKEMIDVIKLLEKKGYTYKTDVGLIFDTSKFKDYSKFAKLNIEEQKAGSRVKVDKQRKNPSDFALWVTNQPKHIMQWDSPWGKGFPGWHIECSAMSSKYLGKQFDIHTGGEEHINVHHTNEIAQSQCAFNVKPWVKYWLHLRWLLVRGEKMAKAKGNLYTISELEEKSYDPIVFRYLTLATHYRKPLDFTLEALDQAKTSLQRLKNIISDIKDDKKKNPKYLKEFQEAMNDDLNTPKALQVLWKLVRDEKAQGKLSIIKEIDKVLGLKLLEKEKITIPKNIQDLVKQRDKARKDKDWETSDTLRAKIKKLGYLVEDTDKGSKVSKI